MSCRRPPRLSSHPIWRGFAGPVNMRFNVRAERRRASFGGARRDAERVRWSENVDGLLLMRAPISGH
jgi:hypothetical protein